MRNFADNLWVFEGEAVSFLSLPFTTRMTIIKLSDGNLWVHSPIRLTNMIKQHIQSIGTVKYLIAPNHLHHLFLGEWQAVYPDALCYGTDEVIKKRKDLTFNESLNVVQKWPWENDICQLLFTGSALMEECVFFHKESQVLIVTDLIENFNGQSFKPWQRFIAKGVGIVAPNGKMPLDWRLSFIFHKPKARQHLTLILSWKPQKIIMAHGIMIETQAVSFLKRSFSWLM